VHAPHAGRQRQDAAPTNRYEWARSGDLLHMDVSPLRPIPPMWAGRHTAPTWRGLDLEARGLLPASRLCDPRSLVAPLCCLGWRRNGDRAWAYPRPRPTWDLRARRDLEPYDLVASQRASAAPTPPPAPTSAPVSSTLSSSSSSTPSRPIPARPPPPSTSTSNDDSPHGDESRDQAPATHPSKSLILDSLPPVTP
jgi:hypothetical protein